MIDKIQDRLNRVNDLKDRKMLQHILYDVYTGVVEHNMKMYDDLESRIYDEIDDPLNKFYIYTCLEKSNNVSLVDEFLHPMVYADLDEQIYDMEEINTKLKNKEELVITSIFMKCDTTTLLDILSLDRVYAGYIRTDKDIHEIRVFLRPCEKYINEIEKLYNTFQYNRIPWNTVNCPYAYKFVDVVLRSAVDFADNEKITEVSIDLAEFDKYKEINIIPLWNIKYITADDKNFPVPARDRINFDHVISLDDFGTQNGYLAVLDNEEFIYCKRYPNDLVVISTYGKQKSWNLVEIESIENKKHEYDYDLMSNSRDLGFIGRYASLRSMVIRTKGEIARLLQSYTISGELLFQGVEVLDRYDKASQTMDYNSFIEDNVRDDKAKKILLLKFSPDNREHYLTQDKMSFLTSEIQVLYPEYNCIGEMV